MRTKTVLSTQRVIKKNISKREKQGNREEERGIPEHIERHSMAIIVKKIQTNICMLVSPKTKYFLLGCDFRFWNSSPLMRIHLLSFISQLYMYGN